MSSHGHVIPNADGSRARCGGPGLCAVCSREAAQELPRLRAELAQARAERDALRADAERFRWIVDGGPYDGPRGRFEKAWREWNGSDNFRAAIDDARAKEKA